MLSDPSDALFIALMDTFAVHPAYLKGSKREIIVERWALLLQSSNELDAGIFASQRSVVYNILLEMARTMEGHCKTRMRGY